MNDFGLVVGNSVHDYLTYNSYAVQWNHGALAKLPGAQAAALGVNDFGVAVGAMGLEEETAVEWKGGALIDLPGLPGAYSSQANAINDLGQAVGASQLGAPSYPSYAVEWTGHSVHVLPGQAGDDADLATAINNFGVVAGFVTPADGDRQAVEWIGNSLIDLPGLVGSTQSEAYGINDLGQVVGDSYVHGKYVATEWSNGRVIDLGALAGASSSEAFAINDFGQVVGWSIPNSVHSFGIARTVAVPEPSTWVMFMVAFAGFGLASRFRRRRGSEAAFRPGPMTRANVRDVSVRTA